MARFFDGKQSIPFDAWVNLTQSSLLIDYIEAGEHIQQQWPFSEIHLVGPFTFGLKNNDGRLVISDQSLYEAIIPHILSHNIVPSTVPHSWAKLGLGIIASLLILIMMLWGVPLASPYLARLIPYSWDNRLGQYALKTLIDENKECVSPAGVHALNKILARLTASLPASTPPFNIKVLEFGKEEINAFTVPGYRIILMDGLLHFANTPEELTGVLAHEMGHALLHHPSQGLIRQTGMQAIIVAAFGAPFEPATQLFHLKYSREDELAADEMAVHLLVQAKISTKGLLSFFKKLKKEYGDMPYPDGLFAYLSSHPSHQERIERIQAQLLLMKIHTKPLLTPAEWRALKKICQETKPFTP